MRIYAHWEDCQSSIFFLYKRRFDDNERSGQKREVDSDYDRTIKIKEKFEEGKQMLEAKNFSDARTTFGTLLRDTKRRASFLAPQGLKLESDSQTARSG